MILKSFLVAALAALPLTGASTPCGLVTFRTEWDEYLTSDATFVYKTDEGYSAEKTWFRLKACNDQSDTAISCADGKQCVTIEAYTKPGQVLMGNYGNRLQRDAEVKSDDDGLIRGFNARTSWCLDPDPDAGDRVTMMYADATNGKILIKEANGRAKCYVEKWWKPQGYYMENAEGSSQCAPTEAQTQTPTQAPTHCSLVQLQTFDRQKVIRHQGYRLFAHKLASDDPTVMDSYFYIRPGNTCGGVNRCQERGGRCVSLESANFKNFFLIEASRGFRTVDLFEIQFRVNSDDFNLRSTFCLVEGVNGKPHTVSLEPLQYPAEVFLTTFERRLIPYSLKAENPVEGRTHFYGDEINAWRIWGGNGGFNFGYPDHKSQATTYDLNSGTFHKHHLPCELARPDVLHSCASFATPDKHRFMRHDGNGDMMAALPPGQFSRFIVRPCLRDTGNCGESPCVSLMAATHHHFYVRHRDFNVYMDPYRTYDIYGLDSSFCMHTVKVDGLPHYADATYVTFQSVNFPSLYIEHGHWDLVFDGRADGLWMRDPNQGYDRRKSTEIARVWLMSHHTDCGDYRRLEETEASGGFLRGLSQGTSTGTSDGSAESSSEDGGSNGGSSNPSLLEDLEGADLVTEETSFDENEVVDYSNNTVEVENLDSSQPSLLEDLEGADLVTEETSFNENEVVDYSNNTVKVENVN